MISIKVQLTPSWPSFVFPSRTPFFFFFFSSSSSICVFSRYALTRLFTRVDTGYFNRGFSSPPMIPFKTRFRVYVTIIALLRNSIWDLFFPLCFIHLCYIYMCHTVCKMCISCKTTFYVSLSRTFPLIVRCECKSRKKCLFLFNITFVVDESLQLYARARNRAIS